MLALSCVVTTLVVYSCQVALLLHQIETKIMLVYNLAFCVVMTTSIMTDPADNRWLLIWTAVFPGFLVVTFQDACTFQARTTLGILNAMLITVALPVLLVFCISLQLNIDGSLPCKALGDGTLDGLNGLGRALQFPMPDVVDDAGVPTSEGAWLPVRTVCYRSCDCACVDCCSEARACV